MKTKTQFITSQSAKKTFLLRKVLSASGIGYLILFLMLVSSAGVNAQSATPITAPNCNTPLVGPGRVVDNIDAGLLSLLGNYSPELNNVVDGDLSNGFTLPVGLTVGETSLVIVKDVNNSYAGGLRVGFVLEDDGSGSLAGLDLLDGGYEIRTYMNDELIETSNNNGTNLLTLDLLGGTKDRTQSQLSFVTTDPRPFNRVELIKTSLVSLDLAAEMQVNYAFVSPATGCNDPTEQCVNAIVNGSSVFTGTIAVTATSSQNVIPIPVNDYVSGEANVIDGDTTNYATVELPTLSIGQHATIMVETGGQVIPAGSQVGFVFGSSGTIAVGVANNITISTYIAGNATELESKNGSNLLNLSLLGSPLQTISFVTAYDCDQININFEVGLGVNLSEYHVYYAFASFDTDGDGVYDCVDKCPTGNDNMDSNGNGIPDACDTSCNLNAGPDFILCSETTSHDFGALNLGAGVTWELVSAPTGATVDPTTGMVSGMGQTGTYIIVAHEGLCTDTIKITQRDALQNAACNTPIVLGGTRIFDPSAGGCLLCLLGGTDGPANLIDGNLNNYVENSTLVSVGNATPMIAVEDTLRTYPAGTRTGFVISTQGGLLNLDLLSGLEVVTFLDGVVQETAQVSNNLLNAELLGGNGQERVGFVTTKPFNGVALYQTELVGTDILGTSMRIYYAFQEPGAGCGQSNGGCDVPAVGADMSIYDPSAGGCLLCLSGDSGNPANVIDADLTNYISETSLANVLDFTPIIGVQNNSTTYPAGTNAGFAVGTNGLLNVNLLAGLEIRTYLNGTLQETATAGQLLSANLLDGTENVQKVSFVTTKEFDAIALFQTTTLNVSLFSQLRVYYAFTEAPDSECKQSGDCLQYMQAENKYQAAIAYENSGFAGVACGGCTIAGIGNLVDEDPSNSVAFNLLAAVGSVASVSVRTPQVIGEGYLAGFVYSQTINVANVSLIATASVTTYLNGVEQETVNAANFLDLQVLGGQSGQLTLMLPVTKPFNEIQFSVTQLVGAAQTWNIYNAFVMQDSDGDGVSDCRDKCCLGDDNMVGDDGLPLSCPLNVAYDASCRLCPVTVSLNGAGVSSSQPYSLYENQTKVGDFDALHSLTFKADTSGVIQYTLASGTDPVPVKNMQLTIHPAAATWNPAADTSIVWKENNNWTADQGSNVYPIWCTDVTIPSNAISYPTLQAGDQCRDITFKDGASVGKIHYLKYRHAFVEMIPERNKWMMVTPPLKYMYSGDYSADTTWGNALEPKVFLRHFDIDYAGGQTNPDGAGGTSTGNFSMAFAHLETRIKPAEGFALWVNGAPEYAETYFPAGTPYQFPRRNATDSSDVKFSYHLSSGEWYGGTFYLTPRGESIKGEPEWTSTSVPEPDNRFRFIFEEGMAAGDSVLTMTTDPNETMMVGNPFMSHLDFTQFYTDNQTTVYDYYRIWDGNTFYTHLGGTDTPGFSGLQNLSAQDNVAVDNIIAPMQAFFVDVKDVANPTLRFTPAASICHSNSKRRSKSAQQPEVIRMEVKTAEKSSTALVALVEGASVNYAKGEDISKLFSPLADVPEIYSIIDETAIEINLVDADAGNVLIPLGIKLPQTGILELSIPAVENMLPSREIYLVDREENKKYDLRADNVVSFEKVSEENLEGRFYISIEGELTTDNQMTSSEAQPIQVFVNDESIVVSSPEEITGLRFYDLSGKMLYQSNGSGKYMETFTIPAQRGVSVLQIETTQRTENHKIVF